MILHSTSWSWSQRNTGIPFFDIFIGFSPWLMKSARFRTCLYTCAIEVLKHLKKNRDKVLKAWSQVSRAFSTCFLLDDLLLRRNTCMSYSFLGKKWIIVSLVQNNEDWMRIQLLSKYFYKFSKKCSSWGLYLVAK